MVKKDVSWQMDSFLCAEVDCFVTPVNARYKKSLKL